MALRSNQHDAPGPRIADAFAGYPDERRTAPRPGGRRDHPCHALGRGACRQDATRAQEQGSGQHGFLIVIGRAARIKRDELDNLVKAMRVPPRKGRPP